MDPIVTSRTLSTVSLACLLLGIRLSANVGPTLMKDIEYLEPGRKEKMDVYLPPERFLRPLPAVLLIHGGGWSIGDKADPREQDIGKTLSAHGYAVFSINYALNQRAGDGTLLKTAWPQNLHDCKSALRFLRARAAQFGLDPARIAVMGGSAGGHLAMLVGATAHTPALNQDGLYPEMGNEVACIITFYGRHDVRERPAPFAGATAEETQANAAAASPVAYFDAATPPMLIAHGTADTVVPVEVSRSLTKELSARGLDYLYIEIADAPHTFDLHPAQMNLEPVVVAFLQQHLGRRTPKLAAGEPP